MWFLIANNHIFIIKFELLKQTGAELEVEEQMPLLEWFANNYKNFGTNLQIVTDRSQEGSQFCKGFGGIGGNFCTSTLY